MSPTKRIADFLKIDKVKVAAVIELLDADNSIPFIARYRKEVTGELDEQQIRAIKDRLEILRSLDDRRTTILRSIREQGKLEDSLKKRILQAETRTELEDIYQPFKPKRKTRASEAKAKGLQPLADLILDQSMDFGGTENISKLTALYLNEQVQTPKDVWSGARDIAAEAISDNPDVRQATREKTLRWGKLISQKKDKGEDPKEVYQNYYAFEHRLNGLRSHQVLAINRGEKEKILRVKVDIPERDWREVIGRYYPVIPSSPYAEQLQLAAEDGAQRLLLPAIERDIRRFITKEAEEHATEVFATNLRNLLNQPPLSNQVVLGIDPGYRTGCKIAVVDPTGKPLETATIYPHSPQKLYDKAKRILETLITAYKVTLIAIGNGTASRETESLVAELIKEIKQPDHPRNQNGKNESAEIYYLLVSEDGASVYSASELARTELPDMDVSMRGAVSIARRVQDPLAELVKIDPKSLGVGMYQHDINQTMLGNTLNAVVESVVNYTGVELNSASPALLTFVSGIGPSLANQIVQYRDQNGPFMSRDELLKVSGLGPKAFEQSAGFLRIRNGKNPLDQTAIHPESYPIAEKLLRLADLDLDSPLNSRETALQSTLSKFNLETLALELDTGVPTLKDILDQLIRPGRDPREKFPKPILRSDVLKLEDLVTGMVISGTVRNVVDFGAFIDIGVKQDGLLHRSQIPRGTQLSIGDILKVKILKVEIERGRISLGWSQQPPATHG